MRNLTSHWNQGEQQHEQRLPHAAGRVRTRAHLGDIRVRALQATCGEHRVDALLQFSVVLVWDGDPGEEVGDDVLEQLHVIHLQVSE